MTWQVSAKRDALGIELSAQAALYGARWNSYYMLLHYPQTSNQVRCGSVRLPSRVHSFRYNLSRIRWAAKFNEDITSKNILKLRSPFESPCLPLLTNPIHEKIDVVSDSTRYTYSLRPHRKPTHCVTSGSHRPLNLVGDWS